MISSGAAPTQAAVPAAMVPLACTCDQLQRAQLRLEVMVGACSDRLDRLQQAFEQLPDVAVFDPFAVESAASSSAALPPKAGPQRRPKAGDARRRATQTRPFAAAGLTPEPAPQGAVQPWLATPVGALPGVATGLAAIKATPRRGAALDLTLGNMLDGIGSLADLGARQVAQLMQRHAPPPAMPAFLGAGISALLADVGTGMGPHQAARAKVFGAELVSAMKDMQAGVIRQQLVGRQGWVQALGDALGDPARSAPQPLRAIGLAPMAITELLLDSISAQGSVDTVGPLPVPAPHAGASTTRKLAPRVTSRLVGPQAAAAADKTPQPLFDAAAGVAEDVLDSGEALAQQISRLLLDQAWMRGVDLK